ncbi:MAG: AAA family ATPase [Chlamydiales bacterium]|nr:AAA family ATPase [Chlamydiales bacterium]
MFILYGPPGVGKSTLGKRLAQKLEIPFFDIDELIEAQSNQLRHELWQKDPIYYRILERKVVKQLPYSPSIIAVGGGTVLKRQNVNELKKRGQLIYMHCSLQTLEKRFTQTQRAMQVNLSELLMQRNPIYETLSIHKLDAEKTLEEQVAWAINLATSLG